MRSFDAAELTQLQARAGLRARLLVWISARDRMTGAIVPAGFWTGDQDQSFTVGGGSRLYVGAGGLLGMDDLTVETGLSVRSFSVWLATAAPEVITAIRGYDTRLAPVEIHRVLTDPLSHQIVAHPHRIFKGFVDGAPLVTPDVAGDGGRVTLRLASAALELTRGLTGKWSDESMKARGGDRLFRYADVSGKVPVYWGEKRLDPAATPSNPAPHRPATGFGGRT